MKQLAENKEHMPFGSSSYVQDFNTMSHLDNFRPNFIKITQDDKIVNKFCLLFKEWITSTKNNSYIGLDRYKFHCYSNGTSESFDKFYLRNNNRRFRCFRGEYLYHRLAWRNFCPHWKFIDDAPLDSNDAVVVSLPFSDTGEIHNSYDQLMIECSKLKIPVLVDLCFSFVSSNLTFNLDYDSITDVVFSLSKTFPLSHARIGMRLTKIDYDDTLFVYQKIAYNNRIGAALGKHFLNEFDSDYIFNKYRNIQLDFCKILKVKPSSTLHFGIGDSRWNEYNRGLKSNRLSFHKYLHIGELDDSTIK